MFKFLKRYQISKDIFSIVRVQFASQKQSVKSQEQESVLLGRPGNTLKMGIVGVPNVGKSSTFNLLSNLSVPAENYPFCTIDPNHGLVEVPDDRFIQLCSMCNPVSRVPATLAITDIAGLVRGASEGEGLGNEFLSHINEVDGIYQVVRAFENDKIMTFEGNSMDSIIDLNTIKDEFIAKDMKTVQKRLEDSIKIYNKKKDQITLDVCNVLEKCKTVLKGNQFIRNQAWKAPEVDVLNKFLFLTSKPMIYLANMSQDEYLKYHKKQTENIFWLNKIQQWVLQNGGGPIIPYSVEFEQNLSKGKLEPELVKASQLANIVQEGYSLLQLIHFFTIGSDEVRSWTVRKGSKAPQAGNVIHSDFEKGFVFAEVIKYSDLIKLGSESAVRKKGKFKKEGKEYVVEDGDILHFKINRAKK